MTEERNRRRVSLAARLSRAALTAVLILTGAAGVTLVTAVPAGASSGYYPCGSPCDGWDPNDLVTLARTDGRIALIYCTGSEMDARFNSIVILRYSTSCQTTWAYLQPHCNCLVSNVWVESYRTSTTSTVRASAGQLPENTDATYMLDDAKLYNRACATYTQDFGDTWQTTCTSRY